jgi:nucleosome binding factor SPN SPT16 subunit
MDVVQEWLNLVEITYTLGTIGMKWADIMEVVREDDRFWYDTDHEGVKKPAGWKFLSVEGDSDDEEEGEGSGDEDSSYASDAEDSEEESSGACHAYFFSPHSFFSFPLLQPPTHAQLSPPLPSPNSPSPYTAEEDSDDESDFDEDDEDDDDEDDDESEEGQDWDELEKQAAAADKAKRSHEEDDEPKKGTKKARR